MANPYYTNTGIPTTLSRATSAPPRNEFALIAAGFDKLPTPLELASGTDNYGVDTGTPGNIVVPINPLVTNHIDGMAIAIKVAYGALGATTILAGALPIKNVVRPDGSPILGGDFIANQIIVVYYNSTLGAYQFTPGSGTASAPISAWVSGANYAQGVTVYSLINGQEYRRIVAGAGTIDPSLDFTNWLPVSGITVPQSVQIQYIYNLALRQYAYSG